MQLVLNAILFCFILLLCGICFAVGFIIGYKRKEAEKPKIEPKPLTKEQQRQLDRQKRHEENFWGYDGSAQETI